MNICDDNRSKNVKYLTHGESTSVTLTLTPENISDIETIFNVHVYPIKEIENGFKIYKPSSRKINV